MSTEAEPTSAQVAHQEATAAAAEATRRLIRALRLADAPPDVLQRAEDLVAEAAELLEPHRVDHPVVMQGALRADLGNMHPTISKDPADFFPYSSVVGPLNPLSPPITLHFDGERVRGTASLEAPYAGPPGMVHGGIIALIFDELLGATNVCHGVGAFTGTLSVRYERPTPLRGELELDGWLERIDGRKVFSHGTISHAGEVTARAEGIFIQSDLTRR
jgi:acyl-coenzyme A thioesterase PaaI-like protein